MNICEERDMLKKRPEKRPGSRRRLEIQKLWKKTNTKELIWFTFNAKKEETIKKAFNLLTKREDLSLDDVYKMMGNYRIEERLIWDLFLGIGATPEDIIDVLKFHPRFEILATKELERIIKKKVLRIPHLKRVLITLFKEMPARREWAWKLLKPLNPSSEKLRNLLDVPNIYDNSYKIAHAIEDFIRRQEKKNRVNGTAQKLEKLINEEA